MSECNRCGCCCVINGRDCKHLLRLSNGKTYCRVYKNRLGRVIGEHEGEKVVCVLREEYPYQIKGCSMNKKEWSVEEWDRER